MTKTNIKKWARRIFWLVLLLNLIPAIAGLLFKTGLIVPVIIALAILLGIKGWRSGHKKTVIFITVVVLLNVIGIIVAAIF